MRAMALHGNGKDGAGEGIHGCKQWGGAIPLAAVRHGSTASLLHGWPRLGALKWLQVPLESKPCWKCPSNLWNCGSSES